MEKKKYRQCPYCNRNILSYLKGCPYCGKEIKEIKETVNRLDLSALRRLGFFLHYLEGLIKMVKGKLGKKFKKQKNKNRKSNIWILIILLLIFTLVGLEGCNTATGNLAQSTTTTSIKVKYSYSGCFYVKLCNGSSYTNLPSYSSSGSKTYTGLKPDTSYKFYLKESHEMGPTGMIWVTLKSATFKTKK